MYDQQKSSRDSIRSGCPIWARKKTIQSLYFSYASATSVSFSRFFGPISSLQIFLADPRHTFCGVGIKDDVDKLYDHHGLRVGRIADLNDLARMAMKMIDGQDRNYRYMGLKKMALALLGKKMEKPLNVTLSKWDAEELDSAQIQYAAIDAAVSFELGFMLCVRVFHPNGIVRLPPPLPPPPPPPPPTLYNGIVRLPPPPPPPPVYSN